MRFGDHVLIGGGQSNRVRVRLRRVVVPSVAFLPATSKFPPLITVGGAKRT